MGDADVENARQFQDAGNHPQPLRAGSLLCGYGGAGSGLCDGAAKAEPGREPDDESRGSAGGDLPDGGQGGEGVMGMDWKARAFLC